MAESGSVYLDGQPIDLHTPRDAISAGICLLTEDRKSQGLILPQSIRENFGLPNLARYSSRGWINQEEAKCLQQTCEKLLIKMTDPNSLFQSFWRQPAKGCSR